MSLLSGKPRSPRLFGSHLTLYRFTCPNCLTTLELRQPLVVVAFAVVLVWYVAAPGEVAVMSVVMLGGLLVSAFLWARTMALHVSGARQLRYAAVQVGDELEELVRLDNASALPVLWAEFVDRSDLPGYTVASVRAADAHSSIHWRARALCARHGLYTLGPWELRLGDPFGIFLVRQTYTQPQEILVYPPLAALPDELLPHSAVVGDRRPLRQPLWAETITATHTRASQPGDPLRHLHWPTTARRDSPYTKVFEPEAASTVWIVPDLHLTPHPGLAATPPPSPDALRQERGGGGEDAEETLMILAASLANHLLHQRLAVGLAAYGNRLVLVPPQPGMPHLWKILRALAPLRPDCPWPLAQTLANLQSLISARDLVIVITPATSADWPAQLGRLTRRGGAAHAILLDPVSFGGEGDAEACALVLADLGVTSRVIRRGDLRPVLGAYGLLRRWEFMTLGTGRVVVKQTPRSV